MAAVPERSREREGGCLAYIVVWVPIPNITLSNHLLVNSLPAWGLKPLNREQFDLKSSLAGKGWGRLSREEPDPPWGQPCN